MSSSPPHSRSRAAPLPAAPRFLGDEVRTKDEAILAAALELFSVRTFDGTPVPAVAERAHVGAGTVYRYFPSKEALVNVLYRRCKLALRRSLTQGRPRDLAPQQEFHWLWARLWRFAQEERAAFRFLELHHHAPYLDAESLRVSEAVAAPVAGFLARAQAAGAVRRAPPAVLLALAFGALVGLVKEAEEERYVLDDSVREIAEEAVWALLRA